MLHVPYKSTPPALEDIIAGRVSMMLADFTTAMPHVNAGTVRPLALSRIRRSALFPDLPTNQNGPATDHGDPAGQDKFAALRSSN